MAQLSEAEEQNFEIMSRSQTPSAPVLTTTIELVEGSEELEYEDNFDTSDKSNESFETENEGEHLIVTNEVLVEFENLISEVDDDKEKKEEKVDEEEDDGQEEAQSKMTDEQLLQIDPVKLRARIIQIVKDFDFENDLRLDKVLSLFQNIGVFEKLKRQRKKAIYRRQKMKNQVSQG